MARGAEAKLRRRNVRKGLQQPQSGDNNDGDNNDDNDDNNVMNDEAMGEEDIIDMFGTGNTNDPFPMPTKATSRKTTNSTSKVIVEDADSDDEDFILPKKSKKKSLRNKNDSMDDTGIPDSMKSSGSSSGIKTTPLILLIMMVGTTVLPALIYVGDYASSVLFKGGNQGSSGSGKVSTMSSIGYYLGLGGPIPKHRTLSFYEKHAPEKISDVPAILNKHYGTYPTLIKKLERKYQDYGYFIGWENDETNISLRATMELLQSFYTDVWITQYWNVYAPQILKTSFRNIRYNLTHVYQNVIFKKLYKVYWKKHIWPKYLEPIFGVPDGVEQQKKRDARDAARNKRHRSTSSGSTGTGSRRKNTEYRDDHDEE